MIDPGQHAEKREGWGIAAFLTTALALGCATASQPAPATSEQPAEAPIVLSDDGKRYLKNVYLYGCATEYLPYPDGEGPPVVPRTDREWSQREDELTNCLEDVAEEYTALETVRMMTWNGTEHTMSTAEMQGIVRYGGTFLEEYVKGLLEAEKLRAREVDAASHRPAGS